MKIAFVGKGGSGKSTLTALYIRYLQEQGRNILAIDADLNMNLAGLLGATITPDKVMAHPDSANVIRTHLKGSNPRIAHIDKFLPTTPPGDGSNLIRAYNDPALAPFCVNAGKNTNLMTVGTYDADGIGQTCYHSHLFVAENLLSHTITSDSFDVVCDMVAGTDAFAYSLHLQFDAIVLIAEPTPESAEVCALYLNLARESDIAPLVHLVGNKIEDQDDLTFIEKRTGQKPMGFVPAIPALKKSRQRGEAVTPALLAGPITPLMQSIDTIARNPKISEQQRFAMLHKLHAKLNDKAWVQLAYGDVMGQIDTSFDREAA